MALQTAVLKVNLQQKIKTALDASFDENTDSDTIKTNLAKAIADAIGDEMETWIKTGQVTVAAGIAVSTAGGPTAQTGSTISTGTGTIA